MQLSSPSAPPDLSEFILARPEPLLSGPAGRLFFIGKRVRLADQSEYRADLLALDGEGRSVVVVLPHSGDSSLLGAALEGAGLAARWRPSRFLAALAPERRRELEGFLGGEIGSINHEQRVVIVTDSGESETLAAAKWLAEGHGIDIRCVLATPVSRGVGEQPSFQYLPLYPEPLELTTTGRRDDEAAVESEPRPVEPVAEPVAPPATDEQSPSEDFDTSQDPESQPTPSTRPSLGTAVALGLALALLIIALVLLPRFASKPPAEETPPAFAGVIADEATAQPIAGAKLYYAGHRVTTDADGRFSFEPQQGQRLLVKAPGYRRAELEDQGQETSLRLTPFEVRGVYLSAANLAKSEQLGRIEELIDGGFANSVIVGIKTPRGYLSLPVEHELARAGRQGRSSVEGDLARRVSAWKKRGAYTIAHVGVFRDDPLVSARPDLALRSRETNKIVHDASGTAWTDPASKPVRDYNVAVARAAAAAGFDEVQFDFVRYPASKLSSEGITEADLERRLANITRFLREASAVLVPENVYVAATVLGSVCTVRSAGIVGQKLEELAAEVDYICPMLYPSSFEGLATDPLENAYPLVRENLEAAAARLRGESKKLRPWLQNFPDPRDPKTPLSVAMLRSQLKAAVDARASGWMFWDPTARYTDRLREATPNP